MGTGRDVVLAQICDFYPILYPFTRRLYRAPGVTVVTQSISRCASRNRAPAPLSGWGILCRFGQVGLVEMRTVLAILVISLGGMLGANARYFITLYVAERL